MIPYVRVIGPKNSGKTCLVEALVRELSARGLRVGTVKHDAHQFEIDHEGKDTWRHRQAGSVATVICSADRLALMCNVIEAPSIPELVARYFDGCDVVLVEGYKSDSGPAICLGGVATEGRVLASLPQGHGLSEARVRELADLVQTLLHGAE
ncbi:MAG: molybdopterin-guanine dinucleotide biosynthesis protein B [Armatimonadetes bacterium]|nr:molybdopterin-guanine dinucleotide biosynthesis protein B [Armatimonadota bacterium]